MIRHRSVGIGVVLGSLGLVWTTDATGQVAAGGPNQAGRVVANAPGRALTAPEVGLLRSLAANPVTAPYGFSTEVRGRQVALRGRVGTKQIHDVAIQTAIALGVPVVDDLVIDTAAAHQVAAQAGYAMGPASGPGGASGAGVIGSLPYTYPPPILGRLDDPFFGFEPPSVSYPPWWNAMSARRLGPQAYPAAPGATGSEAPAGSTASPSGPAAEPSGSAPTGPIPDGTIDMVIDPRGTATLRGNVPSLADRIAIGQQIARTPGVTQVVNLLSVREQAAARAPASDTPPPPPTPYDAPARPQPRANPAGAMIDGPAIVADGDPVGARVTRAIAASPSLAGRPVQVKVRDGVASLSGKVPTVYEAMLAYRSAQQTPGVREVEDRLEFVVPDGSGRNPLAEKGRPEDVEPYLEAQIRRQVGDLAHVDRVRVQGESLELRGTLERGGDRARFDAILRSMPILRGFRVTVDLPALSP